MFTKKKLETKENLYCIAIFTDRELSDKEYDDQLEKIYDGADENVAVVTEIEPPDEMVEDLKAAFPDIKIEVPSYGVYKFDPEKLDEETKKMEKRHKWKKFFNTIPITEYLIVENNVMYDINQVLLFTTDIHEVISYINENKEMS